MKSEGIKLRIDDLKKWPSSALKRRKRLNQDMESALIGVGCGKGLNCSSLHWDEIVIQEILEERKLN